MHVDVDHVNACLKKDFTLQTTAISLLDKA